MVGIVIAAEVSICSIGVASSTKSSPVFTLENVFVRNLSENKHNPRRGSNFEHLVFSEFLVTRCFNGGRKSSLRGDEAKRVNLLVGYIFYCPSQVGIKVWSWVSQFLAFEGSQKLKLKSKSFPTVFHSYQNIEGFVLLWLPFYGGWSHPCALIEARHLKLFVHNSPLLPSKPAITKSNKQEQTLNYEIGDTNKVLGWSLLFLGLCGSIGVFLLIGFEHVAYGLLCLPISGFLIWHGLNCIFGGIK